MSYPRFQNVERPQPEPFPPGEYSATITNAEFTTSKSSGEPMLKVQLKVYANDSEETRTAFDYILLNEKWAWKMKGLCDSLGHDYYGDELTATEMLQQQVKVNLLISKGNDQYPNPKNSVDSYLTAIGSQVFNQREVQTAPIITKKKPKDEFDDDLPF